MLWSPFWMVTFTWWWDFHTLIIPQAMLSWAIWSMCKWSRSLVHIAAIEWGLFLVHAGLQQGCLLSLISVYIQVLEGSGLGRVDGVSAFCRWHGSDGSRPAKIYSSSLQLGGTWQGCRPSPPCLSLWISTGKGWFAMSWSGGSSSHQWMSLGVGLVLEERYKNVTRDSEVEVFTKVGWVSLLWFYKQSVSQCHTTSQWPFYEILFLLHLLWYH